MTYRPRINYASAAATVGAVFALAAICFIAGNSLSAVLRAVTAIAAVAFLTLGIQIAGRYIGTGMFYVLEGDCIKFYRITGRKSVCIANVALRYALGAVNAKNRAGVEKIFGGISSYLSCVQNLYAKDVLYLVFEYDGKRSCVLLEPDKRFADMIRAFIPAKEV